MKKVLLIVVDALAARIVLPALEAGRLPNMQRLIEAGQISPECISIFPSITPAATASIVTGCYPKQHGIAGAFWYDEDQGEIAYYGDDFWAIIQEGMGTFFEDFLRRLNHERLRAETIFQTAAAADRSAACLNYLWYRGDVEHRVHVPLLLKLLPGVPFSETVMGPPILCLGDFVRTPWETAGHKVQAPGGILHRYGFEDLATASHLLHLTRLGLPDFTLAYFPDNDFDSHERGPLTATETLEAFDMFLGDFIAQWDSLGAMLAEVAVLITGDHSQSDLMADAKSRRIDLDHVLREYEITEAGRLPDDDDHLVVCPNMRAAQIYFHDGDVSRDRIVDLLLKDARIDQVMWEEKREGMAAAFHVHTRERGTLEFTRAPESQGEAADAYDNVWSWQGDLAAVDGRVADGRLEFGDYPNALERIAGGFCNESGSLWVTCHLGHEFALPETSVHDAGSHGSLHREDSTSLLIAAGLHAGIQLSAQSRTVDIVPICLRVLGIEEE